MLAFPLGDYFVGLSPPSLSQNFAEHRYYSPRSRTLMRERQLVSTCKQEQVRLQRLAQHWRQKQQSAVPKEAAVEEVRLHHVGLFLLLNGVPVQPYVRRAVLEQFAHPALEEDPVGKLVRQEALSCLSELQGSEANGEESFYRGWHSIYARFRYLAAALVGGLQHLWSGQLHSALGLLSGACSLNESLLKRPKPAGPHAQHLVLDSRLLSHCRRIALLELNEQCARHFEEGSLEGAVGALQQMVQAVLPSLAPLLTPKAGPKDTRAVEEVRNRWCAMLALDMPDEKQEQLQDLLSKLLDPGAETPTAPAALSVPHFPDLATVFDRAMNRLAASGQLELALAGAPSS